MKKSEINNIIELIEKANEKDENYIEETMCENNPEIIEMNTRKQGAIQARIDIRDALKGNLTNLKIDAEE